MSYPVQRYGSFSTLLFTSNCPLPFALSLVPLPEDSDDCISRPSVSLRVEDVQLSFTFNMSCFTVL